MTYITVTAADQARFASFKCASYRRWEKTIQHMVRDELAEVLADESRNVTAIGLEEAGALLGIAAWEPIPDHEDEWDLYLLAVARTKWRNRIGWNLMDEVLSRARAAGMVQISYLVHNGNSANAGV